MAAFFKGLYASNVLVQSVAKSKWKQGKVGDIVSSTFLAITITSGYDL